MYYIYIMIAFQVFVDKELAFDTFLTTSFNKVLPVNEKKIVSLCVLL